MSFRSPVAAVSAALDASGFGRLVDDGVFPELSADLAEAILTEGGRFAAEVVAPLDPVGDREGARLENGRVRMPKAFKAAYGAWVEAGWTGVSAPVDFGGQGLPLMLNMALFDLWNAASPAFAIGPVLTIGAIEAIAAHASDELKALYLPKLVSGAFTGTMNLTEPQAGSDLGALRTRAERAADGTYRITGQKIFITYGDHDLTDNIVHLVLARLPDAPAGTRGISLFLVPKRLPDADGEPGVANDVAVAGIEEKLGLHGSPTCTMVFGEGGGATGWLVGEENRGLAAMFTMMNAARLAVAIQGVGVAERATRRAAAFAAERRQGRAPGEPGPGMSPILAHPDVKVMLMRMRALTDAARAIAYDLAHAIDREHTAPDEETRSFWAARAALLTPVAKAFATDVGSEVASLGVQVHGGMGYIEETGAAQHMRDARIFQIYEGTNGIQAIDLVTRKLTLGEGAAFKAWIESLRANLAEVRAARPGLGPALERAGSAIGDAVFAANWLGRALQEGRQADALAGATAFLRMVALAAGGACLLRAAAGEGEGGGPRSLVARFFAADQLPLVPGLGQVVAQTGSVLADVSPQLLAEMNTD